MRRISKDLTEKVIAIVFGVASTLRMGSGSGGEAAKMAELELEAEYEENSEGKLRLNLSQRSVTCRYRDPLLIWLAKYALIA